MGGRTGAAASAAWLGGAAQQPLAGGTCLSLSPHPLLHPSPAPCSVGWLGSPADAGLRGRVRSSCAAQSAPT